MQDLFPIYDYFGDTVRYSLGTKGLKTLFCIGINPSTATKEKSDNTIRKLEKISYLHGYDSWIMLNIYPKRATDPDNLDKEFNKDIHEKNLQIIKKYVKANSDILCAWGNSINKRKYLKDCLAAIYELISKEVGVKYFHLNNVTKRGNPRHILYSPLNSKIETFPFKNYIKMLTQ